MNGLSQLAKTVIALGKRVLIKRTHTLKTWGIINPKVPLENVNMFQESQAFVDSAMAITLRDAQFCCRYTNVGCSDYGWVGAVEGTPEVETPISDRKRVPIRFDGRRGQFIRTDTEAKVLVAKRIYLMGNGRAEAEFLE